MVPVVPLAGAASSAGAGAGVDGAVTSGVAFAVRVCTTGGDQPRRAAWADRARNPASIEASTSQAMRRPCPMSNR